MQGPGLIVGQPENEITNGARWLWIGCPRTSPFCAMSVKPSSAFYNLIDVPRWHIQCARYVSLKTRNNGQKAGVRIVRRIRQSFPDSGPIGGAGQASEGTRPEAATSGRGLRGSNDYEGPEERDLDIETFQSRVSGRSRESVTDQKLVIVGSELGLIPGSLG